MNEKSSPTYWLDRAVGEQYRHCRLSNYRVWDDGQKTAVAQCKDYVEHFKDHHANGRSLVFIGPKGTGKDHMMVSVCRAICERYRRKDGLLPPNCAGNVRFIDGITFLSEVNEVMFDKHADTYPSVLIGTTAAPPLLAISDPVPPKGDHTEHDQKTMFKVINGRYSKRLPTTATVNVSSRDELDRRLGPQTADRLLDGAIVVKCNWESFRKPSAIPTLAKTEFCVGVI